MRILTAIGLAGLLTASSIGSGFAANVVSKRNLKAYCKGEAAGHFGTKPVYVTVQSPQLSVDKSWYVMGAVDMGSNQLRIRRQAPFRGRAGTGIAIQPPSVSAAQQSPGGTASGEGNGIGVDRNPRHRIDWRALSLRRQFQETPMMAHAEE
jgi:hypothetical protein